MLDPLVIEGRGVDPYVRDGCLDVEALMAVAREWHEYGMARGMSRQTFKRRTEWRRTARELADRLGRQL
jgi:hypothetical protein